MTTQLVVDMTFPTDGRCDFCGQPSDAGHRFLMWNKTMTECICTDCIFGMYQQVLEMNTLVSAPVQGHA